jgi:hypothetical protein
MPHWDNLQGWSLNVFRENQAVAQYFRAAGFINATYLTRCALGAPVPWSSGGAGLLVQRFKLFCLGLLRSAGPPALIAVSQSLNRRRRAKDCCIRVRTVQQGLHVYRVAIDHIPLNAAQEKSARKDDRP